MLADARRIRAGAIAAAANGVVITDPSLPDNPIVDVNPAFERMTGYRREEVVGRNCRFLQGPATDPAVVAELREAIAAERDVTVTLVNHRKDGTPFWNELRIAPVRDEEGRIINFVGVQSDVTARVEAETARARLAAIVESTADAIIGKDLTGIITDWNPAAERLYGYRASEAVGRPVTMLAPPERTGESPTFLATIKAGGRVAGYETVRVAKDGRRLDVSLTISPVLDAAGRVVGASTIARDIGERVRIERELREAKEVAERDASTLQTLIEVGRLLSAELDLDRLLQGIARAGVSLTSAAHGTVVYRAAGDGQEAATIVVSAGLPDPAVDNLADLLDGVFIGPSAVRIDDAGADPRCAAGRACAALVAALPAVVSLLAVPVASRSGVILGALLFGHPAAAAFDERAERLAVGLAAQAAVAVDNARLYQEAQEAIRARDQFLAVAAHELRTPVAALKGRLQLMRRWRSRGTLTEERLGDGLQTAEELVTRLTGLVGDLLDVSRLRLDRLPLRRERLDPGAVVRAAALRHRDLLDGRHRLEVAVAEHVPPISADADRLGQVLHNLLDNAAKYSPDGGKIAVSVDAAAGGVEIRVADEGIGLLAGGEAAIFQAFGRLANADERGVLGLGLGLHICQGIVERHGGRIRADSPGPGGGTTISVWLPAAE